MIMKQASRQFLAPAAVLLMRPPTPPGGSQELRWLYLEGGVIDSLHLAKLQGYSIPALAMMNGVAG